MLASKTAVDWANYLESEFLDLRTFEELGFCLSQTICLSQELPSATINCTSSYSIWITNCTDIAHLTWMEYKDPVAWPGNTLHKQPITALLKEIGISE